MGPQKRALFYVYDGGTGVGHLRRLTHIARQLQGRFACLIVTGHRTAAQWFVSDECEYVHLPSWDSLLESRARYWGRKPFIALPDAAAVQLRKAMLQGIVDAFAPDVLFVDHLPLGAHDELAEIVRDTPCAKYLVTRGILSESEERGRLILGGTANEYLKAHYRKLLVAADRKVFDFARQYNLSPELRTKTVDTGYVIAPVAQDTIARTRQERGLAAGDTWVVASAGGGQLGEGLIEACLALAGSHGNGGLRGNGASHGKVVFDVVAGPRSRLGHGDAKRPAMASDNLRLHRAAPRLADLHASADIVISSGGYNSLLEALQGNARILCFPLRKDQRDEQHRHAACLRKFVDIAVSTDLVDLPALFDRTLRTPGETARRDHRADLDFNGIANIERIVLDDLGLGG